MSSNSQLVGKFLLDQKKKLLHESVNNSSNRNSNFKIDDFIEQMTKLKMDLKYSTNLESIGYRNQYILYFQK